LDDEASLLSALSGRALAALPSGPEPEPLPLEHFPSRLHAFVWRNWGLLPAERLVAAVGCRAEDIEEVAESLGFPRRPRVAEDMGRRGYLTLIRRNWHLLPYPQLLALLGWTEDELAYALREDDFLWVKLGGLKPRSEPIRYREPTAAERARAAAIRERVLAIGGERWFEDAEPRFAFVRELSSPPPEAEARPRDRGAVSPRFLYSYFALYGDPLADPSLDPYPDGYLARLASLGVDGVWLQGILRRLAPSRLFPEEGRDADARLANLRALVERAARHGVGVFLYLNEPRAQPLSFFEKRPELRGVVEGDFAALCTSAPEVQEFLEESARHIFREVPGLRGIFTISASENLTNCHSHHRGSECPRCSKRPAAEVIAEANRLLARGARAASPKAEVIVWDWGWRDEWVADIVKALPDGVRLQSVSEWDLPIERGGVRSQVGEYSISAVGPGPRAARHWALAKARGLAAGAKIQAAVTWEIASVPYVPAFELVAEHLHRLRSAGVTSLMLGWTLGGWPSPNLELAQLYYGERFPEPEEALAALARRRYGARAEAALRAWKIFAEAYREYPFHVGLVYRGPQQLGPANLLYAAKTSYASTMVGFPYDDLDGWRAIYPREVFAAQFEKLAARWEDGVRELEAAARDVPADFRREAERDLGVARACRIHFASVAAQARFVMARDALAEAEDPAARRAALTECRKALDREGELALELYRIASRDARIGFEASNHYFYLPRDLVEKAISVAYLLETAFAEEN
ncbi:MAG: hypothetical protein ACUVYA_18265, partial [Planctomycetota bacterium]